MSRNDTGASRDHEVIVSTSTGNKQGRRGGSPRAKFSVLCLLNDMNTLKSDALAGGIMTKWTYPTKCSALLRTFFIL